MGPMTHRPRPSAAACLLVSALALACNRSAEEQELAPSEAQAPSPSDSAEQPGEPAPTPAPTPSEATGPEPTLDPSEPDPIEPAPIEPAPVAPQTYEQKLEPLIHGATPSADAEKLAWTHYKAKEFPQAQRMFALASLHDRVHWKHPFNLACAAALAEDEAMVRVGLAEAVARDQAAASKKARRDDDLVRYRGAEWFEPLLRGEWPEPAAPDTIDDPKQADDRPTPTPAPSGNAGQPIPPGTAAPLAKARIEQVRDKLK
jgi:hypothetical protein